MGKKGFKKDLPTLPPRIFFMFVLLIFIILVIIRFFSFTWNSFALVSVSKRFNYTSCFGECLHNFQPLPEKQYPYKKGVIVKHRWGFTKKEKRV